MRPPGSRVRERTADAAECGKSSSAAPVRAAPPARPSVRSRCVDINHDDAPSLTIATPSASAVSAPGSSQTGDGQSSQQGRRRSRHHAPHIRRERPPTPGGHAESPSFRQGTGRGRTPGMATPASSRAREVSVAAPAPVAPKLTGTLGDRDRGVSGGCGSRGCRHRTGDGQPQMPSSRVLIRSLPVRLCRPSVFVPITGNGQGNMRLNPDYLGEGFRPMSA